VAQDGAKEAGGEEDGVVIKSKKTVNFLSFNSLYPVDFRLAFYFINKAFICGKLSSIPVEVSRSFKNLSRHPVFRKVGCHRTVKTLRVVMSWLIQKLVSM
jgi:hypothetical protein